MRTFSWRGRLGLAAALLLIPLAGCTNNPPLDSDSQNNAGANQTMPPGAEAVTVQPIKYDKLMETLKQDQGQVVVVDFWSIT